MNKFTQLKKREIGSLVTIKRDLEYTKENQVEPEMLEWTGEKAIVQNAYPMPDYDNSIIEYKYILDIDGGKYTWTEDMFEDGSKLMIEVKHFDGNMTKLNKTKQGDWIDLRCVGGYKVETQSIVVDGILGNLPILERKSFKSKLEFKDGVILEDDKFKQVKFIQYQKGDFMLLDLGIGTKLPKGYECNIVPRSSTFKNFSVLQTNSFAVVDETYCGDNDKYFYPVLAMEDGFIIYDERICQMRINKKMDENIVLENVEKLGNIDRGGCGQSGTK